MTQQQYQNYVRPSTDDPNESIGGNDNRMDKLSNQINEARASLRHYSQNSPLRQQQHARNNGSELLPNLEQKHPQRQQVRTSSGLSYQHNRISIDQTTGNNPGSAIDDKSRPSTDLDQVQGGYTEFFSWGNDDQGQLGHGVDSKNPQRTLFLPKSLSFEVLIVSISCGAAHSGFITQDGHIFTFGSNLDGQLGIDDRSVNQTSAPLLVPSLLNQGVCPTKISCGSHHTMVLTETGDVYAWGRNSQGQCSVDPNQTPAIFSPHSVCFQASHPVTQIECGDHSSALITRAGQLYTFGDNSQGQLGLGNGVFMNQVAVAKPTRVQEIFDEVIQVSFGYRHSLALTVKGQIYGFGSNRRHEMGLGDHPQSGECNFFTPLRLEQLDIHNLIHVAAGGFSAAITDMNQLIVWGTGQFGVFSTPQKVCMDGIFFKDIQISKQESSFAVAVDKGDAIYSWGPNFDGQLGQGDFNTRTLPSQVMRLKRKQIKKVVLGDRFALAIGKDVSLADLKRRKAAKARKLQEMQADRASAAQRCSREQYQQQQVEQEQRPRQGSAEDAKNQRSQQQVSAIATGNTDPPSHRRLNSMHHRIPTAYSRDSRAPQANNRVFDKNQQSTPHHQQDGGNNKPLRLSTALTRISHDNRPESYTNKAHSHSPIPSSAVYNSFQMTQNLGGQNLANVKDSSQNKNNNSPLRQKSRGSEQNQHSQNRIAVGGQDLSADRTSITASAQLQHSQIKAQSPVALALSVWNQHSNGGGLEDQQQHTQLMSMQKSPAYSRINHSNAAEQTTHLTLNPDNRARGDIERLIQLQLEEKEGVIRQQQTTIQDLRMQLTTEQRTMQSRVDDLGGKLRTCERERNDLRTRLAGELRSYQLAKDELHQKIRGLELELAESRTQAEAREARILSDSRERERMADSMHQMNQQDAVRQLEESNQVNLCQLEGRLRNDISLLEDKHRNEMHELERARDDLRNELNEMRSICDQERQRVSQANDDIRALDDDKRVVQDAVISRGKEIRDLQEEKGHLSDHLKAVEIEKDTVQERMQVTISQMNQDISELQKSIGLQNQRLEDASQRDQDLRRQLDYERDMVAHRDHQIDELKAEVTTLRKQIEDQHYRIEEIDGARADLTQRFNDLGIQSSTQQEKLKNLNQVKQNLENQLQTTKLQLERERQRADVAQNDLDAQNSINTALRRDLAEEQRRLGQREADIRHLEHSLNQLKESMGQEFAAKSRDYEKLKQSFDELERTHENTSGSLEQRNLEFDSALQMNRELQDHSNTLLQKIAYQESVIFDMEEKNKKMTDYLNTQLVEKAQCYKEAVLNKLNGRSGGYADKDIMRTPLPHLQATAGRSLSPFHQGMQTPDSIRQRSASPFDQDRSAARLTKIMQREKGQQDALTGHYIALQQQLNRDKFDSQPFRSHEIDINPDRPLTLNNPGTVSVTNIAAPPNMSSLKRNEMPHSIFSQSISGLNTATAEPPRFNDQIKGGNQSLNSSYADRHSNSSPLRQKSPSPQPPLQQQQTISAGVSSLRERANQATATSAANYSMLSGTRGLGSIGGPIQQQNTTTPAAINTQNYSPLRTKSPAAAALKTSNAADAESVNVTNISHRVMMGELKNLRMQVADVKRQKSDIEGRLSKYEQDSNLREE